MSLPCAFYTIEFQTFYWPIVRDVCALEMLWIDHSINDKRHCIEHLTWCGAYICSWAMLAHNTIEQQMTTVSSHHNLYHFAICVSFFHSIIHSFFPSFSYCSYASVLRRSATLWCESIISMTNQTNSIDRANNNGQSWCLSFVSIFNSTLEFLRFGATCRMCEKKKQQLCFACSVELHTCPWCARHSRNRKRRRTREKGGIWQNIDEEKKNTKLNRDTGGNRWRRTTGHMHIRVVCGWWHDT